MEFLHGQRLETAVAVVAVAAVAAYLFIRSRKPRGCLDPQNFKEFKLVEKRQLSHNVAKFKFALPTPTSALGLPIGQHISCRGQDAAGEEVIKPYTPTTLDSDLGSFELVIKMYPQGRMSHHFREMKVGDYLSVKGPKGRFKYLPGQVRAFGMIAGGSGITPMFQVTRAILENPKDNTKVHLIYANVTYEDILLKEELDSMAKNYPDRFKIYYVLNQPPEVWDSGVGFVSKEMIQTHCPEPAADIQSYGRVRIHTGRLEQVVCWLQLLPYEAERRTAQRCQAARLRARYRPVTPRRPSSSSELLLHGSWRVRTCTCDSFVLRESHLVMLEQSDACDESC
ncbi:unnamed protein product [Miscanthus lutarioriparius]|uniref:cytochrome-b5 reductase n=1 Tax=Miscanthus lutarioriparius TaxID=422564 RepID=A0A811NX66_9POAL|nr:unnamed protein product [Miscanthus lutarioriparius]